MARILAFGLLVLLLPAGPGASLAAASDICVDVRIGDDRAPSLTCLNQALQRTAARQHGTPQIEAPLSAASPPQRVGGFNLVATQQQMGNALGISAMPQRPREVFVSPLP